MLKLEDHPTVINYYQKLKTDDKSMNSPRLDAKWLRELCLDAGADDVGFVGIDREDIAFEREDILSYFPRTKTLISFVRR